MITKEKNIFICLLQKSSLADIESQEFNTPTELLLFVPAENSEVVIFDQGIALRIASLSEQQLRENAHLMARQMAVLQKVEVMLMSASAQYRYNEFLETYPNLANRVPQMIASYHGITPFKH